MTAENKGLAGAGAGAGASNLDNFPPDGKKKLEEWEEVVVMRVPKAPREFQKYGQSPGKPPWSPSAGQGKGGLEMAGEGSQVKPCTHPSPRPCTSSSPLCPRTPPTTHSLPQGQVSS